MWISLPDPSKGGEEDASYSPVWGTSPLLCLVVTNSDFKDLKK
jgi:hypothetical protein